jgi:hypothetical protein
VSPVDDWEELAGGIKNRSRLQSMKTSLEVEGLLVATQPPASAANEEFTAAPRPAAGWDPYEVWRTRIKEAQQPLEEAPLKV